MVKRYPEYRSVLFSPISTLSPACASLDAAAHNFSSFHFQEAIRPVPKSSDRALCHEHTSSLVRSSARKKNLDQLKTTVGTGVVTIVSFGQFCFLLFASTLTCLRTLIPCRVQNRSQILMEMRGSCAVAALDPVMMWSHNTNKVGD